MMIFSTDDFENSALTVQEACLLSCHGIGNQGTLFLNVTPRLGLARGNAFFLQNFAICPIL